MAGGKGTRFGGDTEKPMAKFMGKPLIRRVIEAAKESKKITGIYVAVTAYSPKTAQEAAKASVKVVETNGQGYHADVQQAVQDGNLTGPVLIISADLPLLSGEFLYGLSAVSLYEHEGKMYAVSGINIIDGQRILEEQEQEVIASRRPEAVFTVNSLKDLESAKNYLLRTKRDSKQNKTRIKKRAIFGCQRILFVLTVFCFLRVF